MKIGTELNLCCAHNLGLPYESKCNTTHGHNYRVLVEIGGSLDEYGMIIDFAKVKAALMKYDHQDLNKMMQGRPTAENMARIFIIELMAICGQNVKDIGVRVYETPTSYAEETYEQVGTEWRPSE